MKKTWFYFLLLLPFSLMGQTPAPAVKLSLYVDLSQPIEMLNTSNQARIKAKMVQILSSNGVSNGTISEGITVYPSCFIQDHGVVETGMVKLHKVDIDFGMVIEQKSQGAQFASFNKTITGVGKGKEAAIANAISNIKPKDSDMAQFFASAIRKITAHYEQNCKLFIDKANNYANTGNAEKALELLNSIPEIVSCYRQVLDITSMMSVQNNEVNCRMSLRQANSYVALEEFEKALTVLNTVPPTSSCSDSASAIISRIELLLGKKRTVIPATPLVPAAKRDSLGTSAVKAGDITGGLIAFYPFDDETADDKISDNHGLTPNGMTYIVETPNSKGKAISISVKNKQYIQIPFALLETKADYTICFWIKDFGSGWILGGRSQRADWNYTDMIGYIGAPRLVTDQKNLITNIAGYSGGIPFSATMNNYFNSGWHFFSVVYQSSGTVELYIDGRKASQVAGESNRNSNAQEFHIGSPQGNNTMKLDNVRFYNRPLSGQEIQTLYQYEKVQ